jgi:hypothetical protein
VVSDLAAAGERMLYFPKGEMMVFDAMFGDFGVGVAVVKV